MSIIGLPSPGDEDWYDYATSLDTEARTIAAKETPAGAQAKADAALAAANAAAPGLAPVQSVNGQTGAVVIATGGTTDITTHEGAADPHTGYLLEATASATYSPLPPTGGTLVYATEDQAVADANPSFTWLVLSSGAATAPGQVTGLTGTASDGQVALTWTAPSDGGAAITDYVVEFRTGAAAFAVFVDGVTATTSATVTGLTNGTAYDFRVSAVNTVGTGTPSATLSRTPAAVTSAPSQVTGLTATPGSGQVALSWTAPSANGSAITDYDVFFRTGANAFAQFIDGTATTTTATVTGLTNGTAYDFQVRAVNGVGPGAFSATATATPAAVSANPAKVASTERTFSTAAGQRTLTATMTLATPTVGNMLVAAVSAVDFDAPNNVITLGAPSGWTAIYPGAGRAFNHANIFYKVVGASEPTSVDFTATDGSGVGFGVGVYVAEFSGLTTTSPVDVIGKLENAANPQAISATGNSTVAKTLQVVARANPPGGTITLSNGFAVEVSNAYLAAGIKVATATGTVTTDLLGSGAAAGGESAIVAFKGA